MFKLNKRLYDEYSKISNAEFYDSISQEFIHSLNDVDVDNCLVICYKGDNYDYDYEYILPDDIELLSIEDKLTYDLPNDFITTYINDFESEEIVEPYICFLFTDKISHLSIDNQINILKIRISNVYGLRNVNVRMRNCI